MARRVLWLAVLAGLGVFGACCAAPALLRLGVPSPLPALGLAVLVGAALYLVLRAWLARPMAELADLRDGSAAAQASRARLAEVEADAAGLHGELRGALLPLQHATERLLVHDDPAVRRAAQAAAEAVGRANALLGVARHG